MPGAARRHREGPQPVEVAGVEPLVVIDREIAAVVAEAFQRLTEPAQPVRPLAADHVEVDLDRDDLILPGRLVERHAGRIDHGRMPRAAGAEPVYVEYVALEHRGGRPCDRQLDMPVDRAGQHRMQQHFRTHRRELPRRFGEPDVVADRQAKPSDIGDVKHDGPRAAGDPDLVGRKGKNLAVACDDATRRVEHRGLVEQLAVFAHVERARDQPDGVAARHIGEQPIRLVERFRIVRRNGAVWRKLAEQDHLDPGKPRHHLIDLVSDRRDVLVSGGDLHLDTCDREWGHTTP